MTTDAREVVQAASDRTAPVVADPRRVVRFTETCPALLAVGVFVWWTAVQGGFGTARLYPGTVVIVGALFVLIVTRPERFAATTRLVRAALGLGALFALLTLTSSLWADASGDAWDGGNRTVLYVAGFALFALSPLRLGAVSLLLGLWAVGIASVGVATVLNAASSAEPAAFFHGNRLSQPIGYANATGAVLLMAFWPCVVLASRRQLPVAARGFLLGAALVLVDLVLLTQNRASVLAFPVTAAIAFLLVPGRVRMLLTLMPVAVAGVLTREPMLAVYEALGSGAEREAVRNSVETLGTGFAAMVLVGLGFAWADRRITVSPEIARRCERAFVLGATVLMVAAAIATFASVGDPVSRAGAAWDEFSSGERPAELEGSRFTTRGLGDYRSDYWRVALGQFREAPLFGVGTDNFAAAYIEERRTDNEAAFPHSTLLAILSSTGLVGTSLFVGFVGCALVAFRRGQRRDPAAAAIGASAVLIFVYWAVHGSVDWFWEIPALGAPAFAFLGAAAGLAENDPRLAEKVDRAGILVALTAVVALAAATPAWLATRQTEAATVGWKRHPDASLEALGRASKLNPLSDRADLLAGAIANRSGRSERALSVLDRAISRNPVNWYAHFELAVAEASIGRRDQALTALARAAELNPREETIQLARAAVRDRKPVDLAAFDEVFRERVVARTG